MPCQGGGGTTVAKRPGAATAHGNAASHRPAELVAALDFVQTWKMLSAAVDVR